MVQTLVASACSLMTAADRCFDQKQGFSKEEFGRQVRQLVLQRELAAEIVDREFEQAEDPCETINLQWAVEDFCRQAEVRVLKVQAALARAAGDEALFQAIIELLTGLQGVKERSGCADTDRPLPWVAQEVKVG
jgi:hypothetical protein